MKSCSEVVNQDILDAVTRSIRETNNARTAWLSSLTAVPDRLKEESVDISTMPHDELISAQEEDPAIAQVFRFMKTGRRPTYEEKQQESAIARQLLHEWNKLFIAEDGILYHRSGSRDRMVLPKVYQKRVYEELQENMGHLGAERVTELARERSCWPFMRADITHYVSKVCHCLKQRKSPTHVNAPLQPILSTAPLQLVSMDYVHLEPSSGGYQYILVIMLEENMGHLGAERVTELARERFYWPFMRADITHYVSKVCHCLKQRKSPTHVNALLQPILSTAPFQLVSMDYVHLEPSSGGYQYILVIMDHYIRFAQAYATRDKSAKTAADKLFNDFIMKFGFSETIHHDQGGEFENKLFHSLEKLGGVKHSRTTPYHPQGNGQVERFNRTLLSMLRALPEKQKTRWRDHLNKVIHTYNCTRHDSTGFSPLYLLFGRTPRLPTDLMFGCTA